MEPRGFENRIKASQQFGQINSCRIPKNARFHVLVAVDEPMTHANDFRSGNFGVLLLCFTRNLAGRFAHEFEQMGKG